MCENDATQPAAPAMSNGLDRLYTTSTLYTLMGATAAVVIVSSVAGYVFNFNPKWLGLLVAELTAYLGLGRIPKKRRVRDFYFVAAVNGCLIYAQALGVNGFISAQKEPEVYAERSALSLDLGGLDIAWWPPRDLVSAAQQLVTAATTASQGNAAVADTLRDIRKLTHERRASLERQLQTARDNIQATERELATSHGENLRNHLNDLREQEAALAERVESIVALDEVVADPRREASKLFSEMASTISSNEDSLKQATDMLRHVSTPRRSVPW